MKLILTNILETIVLASPRKALELACIVVDHIKAGKVVAMDFKGVKAVSIRFLYTLFNKIAMGCDSNFNNFISLENVSENTRLSLEYLRDNYAELEAKFSDSDFVTV